MIKNITLLFFLFFLNAFSKDYYVSKKGNDDNNGTKKQPFLTIRKAVSVLKPGDTCLIRKGTYLEVISLDISGNINSPITIKSYKN